jgi:hypothetical protein
MRPDPKTRKEPSESSDSLWQGPSRERMVVSRYFFDDEQEPPCTRLTFARSRKVDSLLTGWPLLKFGPGPVYGSPPASKFKGIMKLCHASHSFRLSGSAQNGLRIVPRQHKLDNRLAQQPMADELYVGAGRERPCRGRAEEAEISVKRSSDER